MTLTPEILVRAMADETRLRCLLLLHAEGELCVCELTEALALAQPKISRHLATLRAAGVVEDRRQGHWVHYRISEDLPNWGRRMIEAATEGAAAGEPYARDRRRLAEMADRPGGRVCA